MIGLMPAVFVATPAQAGAGDIAFDADLEDLEGAAFTFDLRRTGGTGLSNVTLYYDTVPISSDGFHPATVGTDFTRLQGTTTFNASTRDIIKRFTVQGTADTLDEFDETFALQFSSSPGGPVLYEAYGTLDDDDPIPTYDLSASATPESSATATVTATLSAASGHEVTIPFSTSDGTATAGTDYTATTGTITVAAGSTTGTATVPITNDTVDEVDPESFTVTGGSATNANLGTTTTISVDIQDNDGTPAAAVSSVTHVEGATNHTATFQVSLSNPSYQAITLDVAAVDGTTTEASGGAGSDYYDLGTTSVTFAPGETTAPVTVTVNDDTVYEGDETATIRASVPAGMAGRVTGPADGTLTITDDETVPVVTLNTATVAEGTSVSVTGTPSGVAERNMTYALTLAGDSTNGHDPAEGPADYDNSSGSVTIPGGSPANVAVPFRTVTTVGADLADENTEWFTVTAHNNVYTSTPDVVSSYQITDDPTELDPAVVVDDVTASVETGTVQVAAHLDFGAAGTATSTQKIVAMPFHTVDGSAKAPADYTAIPNGTVTFGTGQTNQTIDLTIGDDSYFETNETFQVVLDNGDSATVTINDNDGSNRPTFSVTPTVSAAEGAGTATFTVTLSSPAAVPVTLGVAVNNVTTATGLGSPGGNDYTAPTTVVIGADETTGTIPVTLTGDTVFEGDETATVVVSLSGETNVQGSDQSGTLTITDDDTVPVITLNTTSVAEGTSVNVTGTPSGVAEDNMTYALTLAGDSTNSRDPAEGPADYDNSAASVTLLGGSTANVPVAFRTVTTAGDQADEYTEWFTVTAHNNTQSTPDIVSSYGITDDPNDLDPAVVVDDVTAGSETGTVQVAAHLDFGASGDAGSSQKTVTMPFHTVDGTAKAPGDYTAIASGSVSFAQGETDKNIDLTIAEDTIFETDETFQVLLDNTDTATVTITDDDSLNVPTFSVTPTVAATEGQTEATAFTVTLASPAAAAITFAVSVTDTGGTTRGQGGPGKNDFSVPTTVTVAADTTSITIPVTLTNDTAYEGTESATISVSRNGDTNVTGGPHTGVLTITDDETVPTVTLSSTGAAEGGSITVDATPSGVAENAMTYSLTLAGDGSGGNDPADALDFTDDGLTATIPAASTAGVPVTLRTIPIDPDTVDENTEVLGVTVHNDTFTTPDVVAAYQITDDTNDVTPTIVVNNLTVAESANAVVTFQLDYGAGNNATTTEKSLSAAYATANVTAVAPGDYTAATGTVTFNTPGTNSQTVTVPVVDDSAYELNETFQVALTGGNTATVTITDNDGANKPTFSVTSSVSATEGQAGTADFTVTLSTPAVATVNLDVAISDTTTTTADYSVPATVQIAAGATTAVIPVTINNNAVYEPQESASVVVSRGSETNVQGTSTSGTLTITDDESVPTVTLSTTGAAEGGNITVQATPSGVAERNMTYSLTLAGDGTNGNDAAESGDFTDDGLTATIPGGSPAGTPVTLRVIPVTGSDLIDENDETLRVTVHNDTYNTTPDVVRNYLITDDATELTPAIAIDNLTTAETGTAQVVVHLDFAAPGTNAATSTEKVLSAAYTTVDGTAVAPGDYTAQSGTVTFSTPGTNSQNIGVPIVADTAYELTETFRVDLTAAGSPSATVTITDNDSGNKPTFSVTAAVAATEGQAATADFTVALSTAAVASVTLQVGITDGETTGADYSASSSVTLAPGATSAVVPVTVTNDNVYEGTETATVVVSLGGETDAQGGPASGVLTITDDETVPTVTLSTTGAAEGGTITVDATPSGPAEDTMTYSLTLAGDSSGSNDPADVGDFTDDGLTATIPGGSPGGTPVTLRTIPIDPDTVDENTEVLGVTVHNDTFTTPDVVAAYQITDDTNDVTPTIVVNNLTVAESANAVVTFQLDYGAGNNATTTEKSLSAAYATADVTAVSPADYTAATGTVTFNTPGTNSQTITVPIVGDTAYELTETFRVALTGGNTATVTITDDDSGNKPTFSVTPTVAATEGQAGTADFTVTLNTAAVASVTLQVSVTDGETSGSDYTAPSTVTIAAGATTAVVPVTVADDSVYEGDETATVVVARGGESNVQGTSTSGTLTIADDETVPTVTLSTTGAAEGGSITVDATPSGEAEHQMTYSLTLAGDGSGGSDAAESSDYTDDGLTATIPAGSPAGTPVTLRTIPVDDDTVDENIEVLGVTVHNDTYSTADVVVAYQIADDTNDATPTIVVDDLTTAETGTAAVVARLDYGSGNGATTTEKTLNATYATADATAKQPGDYTATSGLVTFDTPGTNSQTIGVPIVADTLYETDETFELALTGGNTATVTITDNDLANKPTFSVTAAATGAEGQAGTTDFTVTLGSAAADDITLDVTVIDVTTSYGLTSAGGDDYSAPATVTIPADQTTATVPVTIDNDTAYEGTETATVRVSLAGGEPHATGGPQDGTLTITDNDAVPALTLTTDTTAEGANLAVIGTPNGVAERDMVYQLTLAGDSTGGNDPAETSDYVDSGATYTLTRGSAAGTPVTLRTFAASGDAVDEVTETVKATVHNNTYTTADVSAFYRITDDPSDLPPAISLGDVTVAEDGVSAAVPVTLTFNAQTNNATSTERATVVGFTTASGTAATNDFGAPLTTSPLTIAAGTTSGTIRVPIVDDLRNETSESFTVDLTTSLPAEAVVTDGSSAVTITDNDQNYPRPSFSVSQATVAENAGSATITVTLSGVAQDNVDLTVAAADVTAADAAGGLGGDDYDAPTGTLMIAQGQLTGTITVPVRQDTAYEGAETARLTVALASDERDAIGDPQARTLTIQDDEARPTIALNSGTAAEGSRLTVLATLRGAVPQRDLLLGTLISAGSGTSPAEPDDYDASGVVAGLPAGTQAGTQVSLGTIQLANDTVDEPAEALTISLDGQTTTYEIADDPADLPPALSAADTTVSESAGTATVKITPVWSGQTTATEQVIKVPWSVTAGTAVTGRDFTGAGGTVTISGPEQSAVVQVPIVDDKVYEVEESFTVRLGSVTTPVGVGLQRPAATVTIKDDDPPTMPTIAVPPVPTGAGAVTLTGTADPYAQVALLTAPAASTGALTQVATATADGSGKYSITRTFDTGTQMRVRASGLTSGVRLLYMKQDPAFTATSTTKGVVTLTVTGNPKAPGGQPVEVQRLIGSTWSTVASGTLSSSGTYVATLKGLTTGSTYTYRGLIWGTTANAINGGISLTRQVTVK